MSFEGRLARALRVADNSTHTQGDTGTVVRVPNVVEFVTAPEYLGLSLYPRQLTWLKVVFLELDLLTDYDMKVIDEWCSGYGGGAERDVDGRVRYHGIQGITPDVLERAQRLRDEGRPHFGEVVHVGGRRGSKSLLGAIAFSYVLWRFMALGDARRAFSLHPSKRLYGFVFGPSLDQAVKNQYRDVVDVITNAACFQPYISKTSTRRLTLWAPAQRRNPEAANDQAAFVLEARESSLRSARGSAAFALLFDEFGYMTSPGMQGTADMAYDAATPALKQFGADALIYMSSSPWEKTGTFYDSYQRALEVNPDTGEAQHPDMLMVHLPTWSLYEDWEIAPEIEMWPGGPHFGSFDRAIITRADLAGEERADPENFAVEYCAQWAASQMPFLHPAQIATMFAPWNGQVLTMQPRGTLNHDYYAHGDGAVKHDNFGFAVAHIEWGTLGDRAVPHVVFDVLHHWSPTAYPNSEIDLLEVQDELVGYMRQFNLAQLTLDQFSAPPIVQYLGEVARHNGPSHTNIVQINSSRASNWEIAKTFKNALNLGLVHAPYYALAQGELEHLELRGERVDHPSRGPVQTSDVAVTMMILVHQLLGPHLDVIKQLTSAPLRAMAPGGLPPATGDRAVHEALSNFGRGAYPHAQAHDRGQPRSRGGRSR